MKELASPRGAWLKAVLGIAISGWAIYLCYTRFNWAEVWTQIKGVPLGILVVSVAFYLSGFFFRAWRASLMLEMLCKPSIHNSLAIVAIGYAGNNLLPFRMGELMRADAATRIYGIRRSSAIIQVGAERILDALAIVALLLVSLLFVRLKGAGSEAVFGLAKLASVGFVIGATGFIFLVLHQETIQCILDGRGRIAKWISIRLIDTLAGLRNKKRLAWVMLASFMTWILEAGSFSVLAVHWGIESHLAAGWFIMGVVNLSVLLPSAPGHIGVYHWAVVLALSTLSVSGANAMGFAVVIHTLQWVSITTAGLLYMLFLLKSSRANQKISRPETTLS